jgi:hypothetical protein
MISLINADSGRTLDNVQVQEAKNDALLEGNLKHGIHLGIEVKELEVSQINIESSVARVRTRKKYDAACFQLIEDAMIQDARATVQTNGIISGQYPFGPTHHINSEPLIL